MTAPPGCPFPVAGNDEGLRCRGRPPGTLAASQQVVRTSRQPALAVLPSPPVPPATYTPSTPHPPSSPSTPAASPPRARTSTTPPPSASAAPSSAPTTPPPLSPSLPAPPSPSPPHSSHTPPQSHAHSIPQPQTTTPLPPASPSSPRSPAAPTSVTPDSPQTDSPQNQCADSAPSHATMAPTPHASSATALSSVPLPPPPIRNALCSTSPILSGKIPSPPCTAETPCSTPLSRSDPPASSPSRAPRYNLFPARPPSLPPAPG